MKGAATTAILWPINNSNHLAQNDLVSRTLEKCNCNHGKRFISQRTFSGGEVRVGPDE